MSAMTVDWSSVSSRAIQGKHEQALYKMFRQAICSGRQAQRQLPWLRASAESSTFVFYFADSCLHRRMHRATAIRASDPVGVHMSVASNIEPWGEVCLSPRSAHLMQYSLHAYGFRNVLMWRQLLQRLPMVRRWKAFLPSSTLQRRWNRHRRHARIRHRLHSYIY